MLCVVFRASSGDTEQEDVEPKTDMDGMMKTLTDTYAKLQQLRGIILAGVQGRLSP